MRPGIAAGAERVAERPVCRAWADRLAIALPWLAPVASALVTLALYGQALGFSFFLDDAYDLTRTESYGFWAILSHPFPDYAYYRPLSFMIWKALFLLTGRYDPVLLHLLPLAAHALAGWLLYLLLSRLTGSPWSLLPALLFLTYPFSFQAVEILGTLMHTLVTAEILAALVLWYDGRTRASWPRLALAGVLAAAALWTHEYGVLVAPLLLALEGLLFLQRHIRRPTCWLLPPLAAEALFLRLWFSRDNPGSGNFTHADIGRNGAIWLQNFAYPASRQIAWVSHHAGGNPFVLDLIFSLAGLALALLVYQLGRLGAMTRWRWLPLLALAGGAFVFVPSAVSLTYEYVQNSPRLFYVVAPAAAAFWGFLPALRFRRPRVTLAWRVAALVLLAVVVVQSVLFIQRRTVMFEYGTAMVDGILREGRLHDGGSFLIMNVPAWFAPVTQEYPRGHLGIQLEPGYLGLDRVVYAGALAHTSVDSGALDPETIGWVYTFQPHGEPMDYAAIDAKLRSGEPLAVAELEPKTIAVREPGSIVPAQPAPAERLAAFGPLQLASASVSRDGRQVNVITRWYVTARIVGDPRLHLQLRDGAGDVVVERTGYALDGFSPPRLWQPGDLIEDRAVFVLPGGAPHAALTARLAVEGEDGAPVPVGLPGGQPVAGEVWVELGQVP